MPPSRFKSCGPVMRGAACASLLLFWVACSGGGGSSPTEPAFPAPDISVLHLSWNYEVDEDEGPVTGTVYPIAGTTIVILNKPGGNSCTKDGVWTPCLIFYDENGEIVEIVYLPDHVTYSAECRTTPEGAVQAYYHDLYSQENPGTLGPLVTSGCSRAEEWSHYAECCLVEP